jgi:hypothetical protein
MYNLLCNVLYTVLRADATVYLRFFQGFRASVFSLDLQVLMSVSLDVPTTPG